MIVIAIAIQLYNFTTEARSDELMRRPEPDEGNSIENNLMGE
jgi:hypothetical protein